MRDDSLTELQRWLLDRLLRPERPPAPGELEHYIAADPGLSPAQRLHIYASGYHVRLLECLRADFPVLRLFLGDDLFDRFAREYLAAEPSRSHTLYQLGEGFADHLERTRPAVGELSPSEQARFALPLDLARLDRAWSVVLRSRGEEGTDLAPLDEVELGPLPEVRMRPAINLRLVATSAPLAEFFLGCQGGEDPDLPVCGPGYVAVSRRNYRLFVTDVEAWQASLIAALAEQPELASALSAAAVRCERPEAELAARAIYWLPGAIARGFFAPR